MRTVVSRLIQSRSSLSGFYAIPATRNGRFLSTDGNKLLVLGGNGFVGSHVCREALDRGLTVASLSRSGKPSLHDSLANEMKWYKGNLLTPDSDSLKEAMNGVTFVISCVGGFAPFGSNSQMYKINGTANINAIIAASKQDVRRFVYISVADFGLEDLLFRGYFNGKRAAETELLTRFPYGGVILKPGFIHGIRTVGSVKLPLSVIGSPLEMILKLAKRLNQPPLVGPLFTPVNVEAVAKVAVRAATDPKFPRAIVEVSGIQHFSQ